MHIILMAALLSITTLSACSEDVMPPNPTVLAQSQVTESNVLLADTTNKYNTAVANNQITQQCQNMLGPILSRITGIANSISTANQNEDYVKVASLFREFKSRNIAFNTQLPPRIPLSC